MSALNPQNYFIRRRVKRKGLRGTVVPAGQYVGLRRRKAPGSKFVKPYKDVLRASRLIDKIQAPLEGVLMPEKWVRLRYKQEVTLNTGAGVFTYNVFRANSCFDPDLTGVGHQPKGWDQIKDYYVYYQVCKSVCKMTPQVEGTSAVIPGYYGIFSSSSSTAITSFTTISALLEDKRSTKPRTTGSTISSTSLNKGPSATAVSVFNICKNFSLVDYRANDNTIALTNASPGQPQYFTCYQASVNGNDPGSMNFLIEIEYLVRFFEPVQTDGS